MKNITRSEDKKKASERGKTRPPNSIKKTMQEITTIRINSKVTFYEKQITIISTKEQKIQRIRRRKKRQKNVFNKMAKSSHTLLRQIEYSPKQTFRPKLVNKSRIGESRS